MEFDLQVGFSTRQGILACWTATDGPAGSDSSTSVVGGGLTPCWFIVAGLRGFAAGVEPRPH